MWKSRADKLPPAQFFADLIAHLRNLYPGASLDEKLARAMRDIWVAEWRAGQSAQDTAKATCSCDGTTIVPSAGAGRDLGKRLARPPKGVKRGDFVAPDDLREVTPLAAARREAERYAQAFDRVRTVTLKLLQVKGWSAAKALRLQKLRSVLGEIKAKHEAAVAKYESIRQSRREAKQPALYEKPLGAVGLTLRPDELPEPPPAKEKRPAKEKKSATAKEPSKVKKSAGAQRTSKTLPTISEPAASVVRPVPQSGLSGNFTVLLEAVPNADFSGSPHEDGRHRAEVRIPAQSVPVSSLGGARALVQAFINDNRLGSGNFTPATGRVRLDGKPFAYISFNGRIWKVDGKWQQSPQELDEFGQAVGKELAKTDCECKKPTPPVAPAAAAAVPPAPPATPVPAVTPAADKPKRGRKPKAASPPTAVEPAKAALSESEAEELANLFAQASAEDKPS